MLNNKPVRIIIIGAGGRGKTYASYAEMNPSKAEVVGVAEPRIEHRKFLADTHTISDDHVFADWKQAADQPKFADAVIISTQDSMHVDPAIAFAEKGYSILLEKPMAPSENECKSIIHTVKRENVLFAVCHVMRYTSYTMKLKKHA
jgi:predicted dehydrogenase